MRKDQPRTAYEEAEKTYFRLVTLYEESVFTGNPRYEILEALETAENAAGRMGRCQVR